MRKYRAFRLESAHFDTHIMRPNYSTQRAQASEEEVETCTSGGEFDRRIGVIRFVRDQ